MNYQLEIKQIVDYPRCRIYRDFLRTLMKDKSIRTNGNSFLCSSHRTYQGVNSIPYSYTDRIQNQIIHIGCSHTKW